MDISFLAPIISIATLSIVYFFLITEKVNKVVVAILGAAFLILTQIFKMENASSQEVAFHYLANNLDILGFVIGMMLMVGMVWETGIFEALAIWIVKLVKGNPFWLLIALSYLTLFMTATLSNIPTILILAPVLLALFKTLKLPALPYLMAVITMANIGGSMTPISDPTTYYQATTVGLSFMEVLDNSGIIVLILSVVSVAYFLLIFRKQLSAVKVATSSVASFKPLAAVKNWRMVYISLPILFGTILLMVLKEKIFLLTGIKLDNASLTFASAFLMMLLFHQTPKQLFRDIVDWEIIFFFVGLFIVVGSLEHTGVIEDLGHLMIKVTGGNLVGLTLLLSSGSAILSTFIDNVPYNISMVSAILAIEKTGIWVYPLWWALNLGTSIGGAGSPIAAACNVIMFGQAEKDKVHINFAKYLLLSLPLVLLNSLIAFAVIWFRYLK